jgi:hypothetical protein
MVELVSSAVILRPLGKMDADEIQVNCGRCGKSIVVRLADVDGKRLLDCVDCERAVRPKPGLRLVRDTNPSP